MKVLEMVWEYKEFGVIGDRAPPYGYWLNIYERPVDFGPGVSLLDLDDVVGEVRYDGWHERWNWWLMHKMGILAHGHARDAEEAKEHTDRAYVRASPRIQSRRERDRRRSLALQARNRSLLSRVRVDPYLKWKGRKRA